MFWNKLGNYVETVDGYLIRKEETKEVKVNEKVVYYTKKDAPAYDSKRNDFEWGILREYYYKTNVPVKEDGTPIGYISREEHERIVEEVRSVTRNKCMSNDWNTILKKAGRPKKNVQH